MSDMGRVPCAFSCKEEFLAEIDRRAASLGMTRSAYIVQVLRQDLMTGNPNLSIMADQVIVNGGFVNHHSTTKVAETHAHYSGKKGTSKPK